MTGTPTTGDVQRTARARLDSAAELETLISALGMAYQTYVQRTAALLAHIPVNDRSVLSLDHAIGMQLSRAGFAHLLERRSPGTAPALTAVVERQHVKLGIGGT